MSKQLAKFINIVMLGAMLFGVISPVVQLGVDIAQAQDTNPEVTEEATAASTPTEIPPTVAPTDLPPTDVPTEAATATDVPTEVSSDTPTEAVVTEASTENPVVSESTEQVTLPPETTEEAVQPTVNVETTEEATAAASETPVVATEPATATPVPTQNPDLFQDDFEDGDSAGWTLDPGWAITTTANGNLVLSGIAPDSAALIDSLDWPHLSLSVRTRVQADNTLDIVIRGGYRLSVDTAGQVSLYRDDTLLAEGPVAVATEVPEDAEIPWHVVNIQAQGTVVTVLVDGTVQLSIEDPDPLGAGPISFVTGAENTGAVFIDDVVINRLDAPVPVATQPATTEAPTEVTEPPVVATEPPIVTTEAPPPRPRWSSLLKKPPPSPPKPLS